MADLRRFVLRHIFLVRKRVWVGGQFHEISNDRPGPGYPLKLLEITVKSLELRHFLKILSAGSKFDAGFLRQMAGGSRPASNLLWGISH